jgi:sulfate/thiosulfate transport system substrate-binding protein
VVDVHADKHGVRAEAEAFLEFHWSLEAQRIFAEEGYRPVVDAAAAEYADKFAQPPDVWTVADWGGWDRVTPEFFGPGGIYDRVLQGVSAAR